MKSKIIVGVGVIIILALAALIKYYPLKGDDIKSGSKNVIRVGIKNNIYATNFLLDIALKKDIFKKDDLKVEKVEIKNGTNSATTYGIVDVSFGEFTGPFTSYFNGQDQVWLASPINEFGVKSISRFPKDKTNEIKTVGIGKFGTDSQTKTIIIMKNLGMDTKKVKLISIADEKVRIKMFNDNKIDFIVLNGSTKEKITGKFFEYDYKELLKDVFVPKIIVAKMENINKNPLIYKKFIMGIYKSISYIKDNKKEALSFLKKDYKFSEKEAEEFYSAFLETLGKTKFIPENKEANEIFEIIKNNYKLQYKDRDLNKFIYADFAKDAVKSTNEK